MMTQGRITRARGAALAVAIVIAALFSVAFARWHTQRDVNYPNAPEYSLNAACAGTAATPFRYRALMLWCINGLRAMAPAALGEPSPLATMFALEMVATFALVVALWTWLGEWTHRVGDRIFGMLLSANALVTTYLLPTKFSHFYWYDIASVLFFTLGLLAITRHRLIHFYLVFLVATVNKETSCFLSVAFLVFRWRDGRTAAILHVAIQAAAWIAIKAALCHGAHQPLASTFWWALPRNLAALRSLTSYDRWLLFNTLGFIPIVTAATGWFVDNADARRLLLVAVPFAAGMVMVGWVEEIRIYGELLPILLPACVLGVRGLITRTVAIALGGRADQWGPRP